ncbi:MAG: enoyl-CoA hydratase/isomerase family protein [Promethearchaeota archaeon]
MDLEENNNRQDADNEDNYLLVERKRKILTIELNRPHKGNSLDPLILVKLRRVFIEAQEDDKVRAIILTAMGQKDFCTGIDVYSAQNLSSEQKVNIANIAGDIATLIYWGKPVVVGLNGRTMGMGVVFSSAADYSIALNNIKLQMPEVNVGIFPGASCIAIMTKVCGPRAAKRILMSGRPFDTAYAQKSDIIDEVVGSISELNSRLYEVAKDFTKKNPINLRSIKFSINSALYLNYNQTIDLETKLADWYKWEVPKVRIKELGNEFQVEYNLTGDPDALIEEYNRILKTE